MTRVDFGKIVKGMVPSDNQREFEERSKNRLMSNHLIALRADLGSRYEECSFRNYQLYDKAQEAVFQKLLDLEPAELVKNGRGIILHGHPGTGKDHLCAAIMFRGIRFAGLSCRWLNVRAWFGVMRDRIKEDKPERVMLGCLGSPDILTLADPIPLQGASLSTWNLDLVYQLIDERYRAGKPTFVTVNLPSEDAIRQHLTAPVVDRLLHNGIMLQCNWPSFRRMNS